VNLKEKNLYLCANFQANFKMSRIAIIRLLSIVTALLFLAFTGSAAQEKKFNVTETIMHHVLDAHEWHLWGEGHQGTSIYLPVILYDNGIKVFSSKHLYHGKAISMEDSLKPSEYLVGEGPAEGYALLHEKIYKLNNGKLEFHGAHPKNPMPLDLSITKNVLSLFIGAFILLAVMLSTSVYYKKNGAVAPRGIAKFIEPLIVYVRDEIVKPNIHGAKHTRYIGFITTAFFFILVNNLLGMIPVFPGGANLTGNISVTLFLAVCTLLVTVFSGNKNYWRHIFATPGVPWVLLPIMIPIELVGIFTKPFALMIRLFANLTAGHIIILALISIIFINKSAAWGFLSVPMALFISVLEILVAFLQAYLFASLSALFIGAAVEEDHH
jgi:F-type H+-transporting ATPase subunit a